MVDPRLSNLRGASRRDFLRWSGTLAAALGLDRARFLNVLSDTAGVAMADGASCATTARSVHFVGGNGGLSNFSLIFPQVAIAQGAAANPNFAFHAPGMATMAAGTNQPLAYAPESPFQKQGPTKQMTMFMAGSNETHTTAPVTAATVSSSSGMISAVAAIQAANPTLLPVIGVTPLVYGVAPGSPAIAQVADSAGLVGLFNSQASQTLLATPQNASLHEAYYKAFVGLNAAAGRASMQPSLDTGKVAANLLGRNLASALTPTAQDDINYGINSGSATKFVEIAHCLCTGVKAFKLGLTSCVIFPAMLDDPHDMFDSGNALAQMTAQTLGQIITAFMNDCAAAPDPSCSSQSLADSIIFTIHGDTTKDPTTRSGWPDGTVGNSNTLYVYGNGFLKTGWFGDIGFSGGQATMDGWDPTTGASVPGQASSMTAAPAAAAVLYAVSKGDSERVEDFYTGPSINGVINLTQE
jgi:hypothetical protein